MFSTVNYCAYCGAPATLVCSTCNEAYYCSRECQRYHWKRGHRLVCSAYTVAESIGGPVDETGASSPTPEQLIDGYLAGPKNVDTLLALMEKAPVRNAFYRLFHQNSVSTNPRAIRAFDEIAAVLVSTPTERIDDLQRLWGLIKLADLVDSMIRFAVERERRDVLNMLHSTGLVPTFNISFSRGMDSLTPLLLAVVSGGGEMVPFLLERRADPMFHVRQDDGYFGDRLSPENTGLRRPLTTALQNNAMAVATMLMDAGAVLEPTSGAFGVALFNACQAVDGTFEGLATLLSYATQEQVAKCMVFRVTPFFLIVQAQFAFDALSNYLALFRSIADPATLARVMAALSLRPDSRVLERPDRKLVWVPLIYVAENGTLTALRSLAGMADVNLDVTDDVGRTALFVALKQYTASRDSTFLLKAKSLLDTGASIDERSRGIMNGFSSREEKILRQ